MGEGSKKTPMMRQYLRIKAEYPDAVLFFHLGDFYEAFFEDAETLSRELDVVLTSRNGHPMAGVPIRRGDAYVNQLLQRGHKVAICQQVEDPKKATGLVKRDVVRVVTPGTAIDDVLLDEGANNYLAAVTMPDDADRVGVAFLDLSTGEFTVTTAESSAEARDEIARRSPSEVLIPEGASDEGPGVERIVGDAFVTQAPAATFTARDLGEAGTGIELGVDEAGLRCAGAILAYVERTQKALLGHIRPLRAYRISAQMDLDPFTVGSLELIKPLQEGNERGTLLRVLDRTVTGMGRRLLRRWILAPLLDRDAIERRLDAVDRLVEASLERQELRDRLASIHDVERLIGKLGAKRMRPGDLVSLLASLEAIPETARTIDGALSGPDSDGRLRGIAQVLNEPELEPLQSEFSGMLVDQPPVDVRDGGLIRPGYHAELDLLRQEARSIRDRLASLEQSERERTSIPSLKVGYNRVFGYYIEVTRPHLDKVPPEYQRRQTLANAERFVTEELKSHEERIAGNEERAKALELELFEAALARISERIPLLQSIADAIAELDVLVGLADVAHRSDYVRPTFTDAHEISIRGGRHPVVERIEEFVPNDLDLPDGRDLVILTGPNMAGKSVFLRQTALISLMAQIGSFVPASEARLAIVDRVFARVGASDMLVAGISTFMMEMLEVATILRRATSRSLIILDEMGRGTSTFDGVSIAWAVARELATRTRAKTLFATHYQELTRLADDVPNVVNLHVSVKELGKEVVFLHRVVPGTAAGSYGVHVARLAGLPDHVTESADRILEELLAEAPLSQLGARQAVAEPVPLFGSEDHPVVARLRRLDPDALSPRDALQLLYELKDQAE